MDNRQIKDGLGNLFTLRMKDVSSASDGSMQQTLLLASSYPIDYGLGGIFQHCARAAEFTSGAGMMLAPVYAFQWPSTTLLAAVSKVRVVAWSTTSGFVGGFARFSLFAARQFTAQDTGGLAASLVGNNGKLRTAMGSSGANIVYANGAPLTPGTRVLDTDPLHAVVASAPVTANTPFTASPLALLDKLQGEHPLLLGTNEGFVIQSTTPITGTWQFNVTTEWAEIQHF